MFELPSPYQPPIQCVVERFDQMLGAQVAFRHIFNGSKRGGYKETFVLLNVLLCRIPIVQYARSGGALSEAFGHRKMELCRHDISKIMESESAFMRDNGLYLSFSVSAPKCPSDKILMRTAGIIPKPKQAMVDQQPIPPFSVKVLLAVRIANRERLESGEIAALF